jgi:hypothetical protein
MIPPPTIQRFRDRCEKLVTPMYQLPSYGYLGQVEIVCKMPTPIYIIEIQEIPISSFSIDSDEARQWHPGKMPSKLYALDSATKLVDFCEKIVFKIYEDSGYGFLNLKFWHLEKEGRYKVLARWTVTYQQTA